MDSFQLSGLPMQAFAPLFSLSDAELSAVNAQRMVADGTPGFPCRVSLVDAGIGDELLLLPYEHQSAASPYRASGPIFVRRNAQQRKLAVGELSAYVTCRVISMRGYNADHQIIIAEVCDGEALRDAIQRAFANSRVDHLHLHNAARGCYSCRVDRVAG